MIDELSVIASLFGVLAEDTEPTKPERVSSFQGNIHPIVKVLDTKNRSLSRGISADLLYWDVQMDGANYALSDIPMAAAGRISKGRFKSVKTDFEAGVRLGWHMTFSKHDLFDLSSTWTYHEASKRGNLYTDTLKIGANTSFNNLTVNGICTPGVIPFPSSEIGNAPISTPAGFPFTRNVNGQRYKNKINFFDVELGRKFRPLAAGKLLARPHFGMRFAKVDHSLRTVIGESGTFVDTIPNTEELLRTIRYTDLCEFKGIGLRFGLDTQWVIAKAGLSFFAKIAWSYLCAEYEVNHLEFVESEAGNFTGINGVDSLLGAQARLEEKWHSGKSIIDLFFGIMFESTLNDGALGMTIKAGWEQHRLFEQNQYMRLIDGACKAQNHGDLLLRGFTLSAQFDF